MEIKINIPKNDYKEPTEVRQDVVQRICEIFLAYNGRYRWTVKPTWIVEGDNNFWNHAEYGKKSTRVHGVEMQAAFKALTDAGYYIHKGWTRESGTPFYLVSKKPFVRDSLQLVSKFTDFID